MTRKKQKILNTALELFARDGFHAVSTSRVAREAEVSEALIFRHFENKQGLLNAVMDLAANTATKVFAPLLLIQDPKEFIRQIIEVPFHISSQDYGLWRMIYSVKWQNNFYSREWVNPMMHALEKAFEALKYKYPKVEAELIVMLIDGVATSLLLHPPANKSKVLHSLLSRYDL